MNKFDKIKFLFIAPGNLAGNFSNIPIGIAILGSILRDNGVHVIIKDYSVENLDYNSLQQFITENQINIVGITMMTCQSLIGYQIAKFIKSFDSKIITLSGGIHPSLLPKESLKNHIDIVFQGEAEHTLLSVLHLLSNYELDYLKLERIKGISFLRDGIAVTTGSSDRIDNLDALPMPAYDLFPFPEKYSTQFLYKPGFSTNLITSRGCTNHCVFCSKFFHGVYYQSAEKVVEQFVLLKEKYNISQIFIQDDLFSYDPDRVLKICDLLIKERVDIPWVCSNTRADTITLEIFQKMKQSGCISVAFGVESGNEEVRRKIGKQLRTSDIFTAVKEAKMAGLFTSAFYIFGHHCESYQNALETISFAKKLNTDTVSFSINCPFPGTTLYKILTKKGVKLTTNWGKYRTWGEPLFETDKLTKRQIINLQKKAYRDYFLRLPYLISQFKKLINTRSFTMYRRGFIWLLEQYFDYKVLAANKPQHLQNNKQIKQLI